MLFLTYLSFEATKILNHDFSTIHLKNFWLPTKNPQPEVLYGNSPVVQNSHLHGMPEITQGFNELKKVLDSERADTVGIWWLLGSQESPTVFRGQLLGAAMWLVVDG